MKKYFSLASALMLALSMGMTSCSNDLDEMVTEQQPEMRKLYLSATAPNTPETRAYVEGTADSDAIRITGWKAGDKLYGIYQNVTEDAGNTIYGAPASVEFEFNGTEFESEETTVTKEQIAYFIHGNGSLGGNMKLDYDNSRRKWKPNFQFIPTNLASKVDVEGHDTDILMFGNASVDGEKLTADMQLPKYMTFICLHNDCDSPITAKLINVSGSENDYLSAFYMSVISSGTSVNVSRDTDSEAALKAEIPAHGKAYLPTFRYSGTTIVEVNGTMVASKTGTEAGKVYKLTYPSSAFVAL